MDCTLFPPKAESPLVYYRLFVPEEIKEPLAEFFTGILKFNQFQMLRIYYTES